MGSVTNRCRMTSHGKRFDADLTALTLGASAQQPRDVIAQAAHGHFAGLPASSGARKVRCLRCDGGMHGAETGPRRRNVAGQAMLEFAMVVPVMFLLIFACLEGSLLVFGVGTASFAGEEGARVAAEEGNLAATD